MRAFPPLARLLGASLLMDGAYYLILTAVPLRAIEFHATPLQLGILPLLGSGVYIGAALLFGRLSDRLPRMTMARLGAWLRVGIALGVSQAHSIASLMAWMPLLGIASGLFWPALQAAIGEVGPERELGRSLGGFNISWSSGKMLGFLAGGALIAHAGYNSALFLAAGLTVLVALVLPNPRPGKRGLAEPAPPDRVATGVAAETSGAPAGPEEEARRAWRWIGWLANFLLFGVGATLNYQYPKLLLSFGFTSRDFGIYLGAIYLFQTLTFICLTRWRGWHYRLLPLLMAQGLALASVALLGWLHTRALIWATAPGIGLGMGWSYSSSLYYSLFREAERGRSTGIHEALLGSGTFLLPLLGGIAAQATRSLLAPYLLCAVLLALGMTAETLLALSAGRRTQSMRLRRSGP